MKKFAIFLVGIGFSVSFFPGLVFPLQAAPLQDGLHAYYQKQWADAASDFRQAMEEEPNNSLALAYYIVSNFWQGTDEHMMRTLEERLDAHPNDQPAQVQLAFAHYTQAYLKGEKPEKARQELQESARIHPSALIHTGLGIIFFDSGNFSRAEKEFAHALDRNPDDILAHEYLGRILLKINDNPRLARRYFQEEVDLEPEYPDSHYYLARAEEEIGNQEKAISEYGIAIQADPMGIGRGFEAEVGLGDLYAKRREYENAREAYKAALKFSADDVLVKKRLKDLEKAEKSRK